MNHLLGCGLLSCSQIILDLGQEDGEDLADDLLVHQDEVQSCDGLQIRAPVAVPILRGPRQRLKTPLARAAAVQVRGHAGDGPRYMHDTPPKVVPVLDLSQGGTLQFMRFAIALAYSSTLDRHSITVFIQVRNSRNAWKLCSY